MKLDRCDQMVQAKHISGYAANECMCSAGDCIKLPHVP